MIYILVNTKAYTLVSILTLAMIVALFGSCSISRGSLSHKIEDNDSLLRDNVNQLSDVSDSLLKSQPWEEYFDDDILKQHIKTALNKNSDYRVAVMNILKAEEQLKQVKTGLLPELSAGANGQKTFADTDSKGFGLTGNFSWELDVWGKIRKEIAVGKLDKIISEVSAEAIKASLVSGVAESYLNLLSLDKQLEVVKRSEGLRKEYVKTIKVLKTAGLVNDVDLQQAYSDYYAVQNRKELIKQQINSSENALSVLLGMSPHKIKRGVLRDFIVDDKYSSGVPAKLLSGRPDVKLAELEVMRALKNKKLARSQFYPSLRITGKGGYESLKFSEWITPESALFNLVGSLSQPLLNKRRIRTQHEIAKISEEQALIKFEQAMLDAGKEVSDVIYDINSVNIQFSIMENKLEASNKAVKAARELLNNGIVNYLDLLIAQENALNAKLSLVNLASLKMVNKVKLYRALGGGTF